MSPCSPFAFVKQTLRCSVSTPVRVPTYVFPWLVTMLTCFCRRLESSSMNLRPAVEDNLATFGRLPGTRYIIFGPTHLAEPSLRKLSSSPRANPSPSVSPWVHWQVFSHCTWGMSCSCNENPQQEEFRSVDIPQQCIDRS